MSSHSAPHSASPAAVTSATVALVRLKLQLALDVVEIFSRQENDARRGGRYEPPSPQRAARKAPRPPMSRPTAATRREVPRGSKRRRQRLAPAENCARVAARTRLPPAALPGCTRIRTVREPSCGTDARSAASSRLARRLLSETEGAVGVHGPFPCAATSSTRNPSGVCARAKRDLHGRAAEFDDAERVRGSGAERARGVVGGDPGVETLPGAGRTSAHSSRKRKGESGGAARQDRRMAEAAKRSTDRRPARGHEEGGGGGEGGIGDVFACEGEKWGEGRARRGWIVVERGEAGFGAHDGFPGVNRGIPRGGSARL